MCKNYVLSLGDNYFPELENCEVEYVNLHDYEYEIENKRKKNGVEIKIDFEKLRPLFKEGNKYLCCEKETWAYVNGAERIGFRNEGFLEARKCKYINTDHGIFKFVWTDHESTDEWLTEKRYKDLKALNKKTRDKIFLNARFSTGIGKKSGRPWYRVNYLKNLPLSQETLDFFNDDYTNEYAPEVRKWKRIIEEDEIVKTFNFFINKPVGTWFGLDYETSGPQPFDSPDFHAMGVGIAEPSGIAAYFDIEYIDRQVYKQIFYDKFKEFCDKHNKEIYAYNCGFEMRVTYLLLKQIVPFHDSATINKLMGDVAYNLSLKYTSMRYNHTKNWDGQFDELEHKIGAIMYGQIEWENRGLPLLELKDATKSEFWKDIMSNTEYSQYKDEFLRLMNLYWGDPFACIPGEILARYCCKDAFYTVYLRQQARDLGFSDTAWNCFSANLRLGALLNIGGVCLDKDCLDSQRLLSHSFVCYGYAELAKLHLTMELEGASDDLCMIDNEIFNSIVAKGINPLDPKEMVQNFLDKESKSGFDFQGMSDLMGKDITFKLLERFNGKKVNKLSSKVMIELEAKLKEVFNIPENFDVNKLLQNRKNAVIRQNLEFVNKLTRLIDVETPVWSYNIDGKEWTLQDIEDYLLGNKDKKITGVFTISAVDNEVFTRKMVDRFFNTWYLTLENKDKAKELFESGEDTEYKFDAKITDFKSEIDKEKRTLFNIGVPAEEKPIDIAKELSVHTNKEFRMISWEGPKGHRDVSYEPDFPSFERPMCSYVISWEARKFVDRIMQEVDWNGIINKNIMETGVCNVIREILGDYKKYNSPLEVLFKLNAICFVRDKKTGLYKSKYVTKKDDDEEGDASSFEVEETENKEESEEEKEAKKYDIRLLDFIEDPYIIKGLIYYEEKYREYKKADKNLILQHADEVVRNIAYKIIEDDDNSKNLIADNVKEWDITIPENIRALEKIEYCYRCAHKFQKAISSYLESGKLFGKSPRTVGKMDENGIITERWDHPEKFGEEGYSYRFYPRFNVIEKKTGRWSSPMHTLPAHDAASGVRACIRAPKGMIISYFDISG